jgi:hypothetical protein
MSPISLILNVLGIFIESLAVLFGLKRLFKEDYDRRTTPQKRREERTEDVITLVLIMVGAFLQIIAVIFDFIGFGV